MKLLVACVAALLVGVAAAVVVEQWILHNTGTIAIATYLTPYANSTAIVTSPYTINWGTLDPGATYVLNLTVHNVSPIAITVTLTHTSLPTYLTCTWTANHTTLTPDAIAIGDLELTVAADAPPGAAFAFTSTLTADAG